MNGNMIFRKMFVVIILAILMCPLMALSVQRPYIFDWNIENTDQDGMPAIPFPTRYSPTNSEIYHELYAEQYAKNEPLSIMLYEGTSPYNGTVDPCALSNVIGYVPRLDFVFSDIEDSVGLYESTVTMVQLVRNSSNPNVRTAYIGNYAWYPGTPDYSQHRSSLFDRTVSDSFYRNSGLNIAMPNCYPYEYLPYYYEWCEAGEPVSPNHRSSLFWGPLERCSVAKRALPAGHLLIPWVAAFVGYTGYEPYSMFPPKEDSKALIKHYRLRGTDGYIIYAGSDDPSYAYSSRDYRLDTLDAWHSLDPFFSSSGPITIINLTTNQAAGIEWSGAYKNGRIKILISNLGSTAQSVSWTPVADSNMPMQSPVVQPNTHIELDYRYGSGVVLAPRVDTCPKIYSVVIPPSDYVCIIKDNTRYTNLLRTNWYYGDCVSYLKYNLSGIPPAPTGQLRVIVSAVVKTDSSGSGTIYKDSLFAATNDAWSSSTITWSNKPVAGTFLDSSTYPSGYMPMKFSSSAMTAFVSQQVDGDKTVSFQLTDDNVAGTQSHGYYGSYAPANLPVLWIDYYYVTSGLCNANGDYNRDSIVDFDDLAAFADEWLWTGRTGGCNQCDLDCDGNVGYLDLGKLIEQWLDSTP